MAMKRSNDCCNVAFLVVVVVSLAFSLSLSLLVGRGYCSVANKTIIEEKK